MGSSVYAQLDSDGNPVASNFMDLMSGDLSTANARMGECTLLVKRKCRESNHPHDLTNIGVAATC
ncbi:hypothetical protein P4S63_23815 [Pseudoalteromonas sp. B193]